MESIPESIFVAHWDGLLGVLTQGDVNKDVTWTEENLIDAFYEMGTFVSCEMRTPPKFISDLMNSKCTVFDITDSGISNWMPYKKLSDILGATGWTEEYLNSNISPFANWTKIIRTVPRPDKWSDEEVVNLKERLLTNTASMKGVFDVSINLFIQKVHLDSLVWAMQTMTEVQREMMSECIELALISNLEYEMFPDGNNFKGFKQDTNIRDVYVSVRDLPWDRDAVISTFNTKVMVQTFAVCAIMCKSTNNCLIRLEYRLSILHDKYNIFDMDLTVKKNMKILHEKYRDNFIEWATEEDRLDSVPEMEEWLTLHMKLYNRLYHSVDRNKYIPFLEDYLDTHNGVVY